MTRIDEFEARSVARRRARAAKHRRRRIFALGVLAAAVLAVVAAVALSKGGNSPTATPLPPVAGQTTHTVAARHPAATGIPGTDAVPILMYHVIAPPPPGAPFPGLYVPAAEFKQQMIALKDGGWHAVTMDQLRAYWTRGVPLGPGKPIVITFDNGYLSQYTKALPILQGLGWVAVENLQLTGLPPSQGGMSERQVKGLVAAGWELDTQGISHADLITLDATQLHNQVAVARHTIQRLYGVQANWFCYPSGHYDATVVAAVRAAGFVGSTTVVPGWGHGSDDPYRLHRLRVLGGTTGSGLLQLIESTRANPPAPASYSL